MGSDGGRFLQLVRTGLRQAPPEAWGVWALAEEGHRLAHGPCFRRWTREYLCFHGFFSSSIPITFGLIRLYESVKKIIGISVSIEIVDWLKQILIWSEELVSAIQIYAYKSHVFLVHNIQLYPS